MAGRYERVNVHDDEPDRPRAPRLAQPIPSSPPPSFHSRASSLERRNRVDSALADAFDADGDESEDEADDRQRLVRSNTTPGTPTSASSGAATTEPSTATTRNGYQPVSQPSSTTTPLRVFGGGTQSDGVFTNMSARPELAGAEKEELPPTYEQAAADQAPPYWETTILAPGLGGPDDVFIDGLPVGSLFGFLWNALISWSFPIVGFLITYLLHATHAAKNGSRAGLGVTLIQYGFSMKATSESGSSPPQMNGPDGYANPPDPNAHDFDPSEVTGGDDGGSYDISGGDWLAYVLMVVGWFILIRAVSDYIHARRHEQLVLQSPDRGLGVAVVAEGESSERVV